MRSFFKRNRYLVYSAALFAVLFLSLIYDAAAQSSTRIFRVCPGATPSPAKAMIDIEKDGDVVITNCSGKTTTITGTVVGVSVGAAGNGNATTPSFSFASDPDTGVFRSTTNALGFSTGGTERGTLDATGLFTTTGGMATNSGGPSAPAYSFAADLDTGMYRKSANTIGFAANSVNYWTLSNQGTYTSSQGTLTTSQPAFSHGATWNDGAVTFQNIFSNVTDTASASASTLIDLQVGLSSKFNVTKAGAGTFAAGVSATTGTFSGAVNKVTITPPASGSTLTIADGKVLTASNTLTFAGTDSTVMTFPSTSATIARTDAANTFTGVQTMTSPVLITPGIGVATGTSLTTTGLIKSSGTAGIGYATGAGGAQTQATDKSTTVVSNTITTAVTLNAAQLDAGTAVSFTFTNSTIAATDTVVCTHQSAGTSAAYACNAFPGAGSAVVTVRNLTAGNLSEAIVLRVTVIKSVSN